MDFSQQLAQSALACFGEHAFLFALCYGWRDFVDKNEIDSGRVFEDLNLPNCESNPCGDFVKFINRKRGIMLRLTTIRRNFVPANSEVGLGDKAPYTMPFQGS